MEGIRLSCRPGDRQLVAGNVWAGSFERSRFRSAGRPAGGQTDLVSDFSYADVVERLFREFDGQLPLPTIVEVVHQCLADLQGQAPPGALAELLERSARQRLSGL